MRCHGIVVRSDRRGKWMVALLVAAMASGTAMATGQETRPQEGSLFNVLGSVIRAAVGQSDSAAAVAEAEIAKRVQSLIDRKTRVSSISATADAVYIACQMSKGYGFEVWKMDRDCAAGESIVKSLRGCCGQMDVKARGKELFVAENARHRVCRYDNNGKMIVSWGKSARQGIEGFGSCCNPMNVCFGPDERVYTAETTSGRIKCYRPDGTLVELVGKVKIVPGCNNVAIDATQDGSRVYMLDITRSHIVVMERKEAAGEKTAAVTH